MVFKHNKLPFEHHESLQLSFQRTRQMNCGDQFASFGHRHIPDRPQFSDGVSTEGNLESENMNVVTSNANYGCIHAHPSNMSCVVEDNGETGRWESGKRSFAGVEDLEVVSKRIRQTDENTPPLSNNDEGPFSAFPADDEFGSRKNDANDAIPSSDIDFHGRNFSFSWFPCNTSEEDIQLELPIQTSFFPGYYEDHRQPAGYNRVEEFDYHPRKRVAIGADHQADLPEWRPKTLQDCDGGDCPDASTYEESSKKWIGYCVIAMPDSKFLDLDGPFGQGKIDCCCLDEGSIRCVRQHVTEAREVLRKSLGDERFVQLGFCDMGEDVAMGWTDEEEQLFHEVVASNPASLGKNFWEDLLQAFPLRTSKELVSYYFNVFMLRKRAEQNRSDPLNLDSDNDEWQESDEGEFGATEEDEEDSGVESPTDAATNEDAAVHGDEEVDIHEEAGDEYTDSEEYGNSDGLFGGHKMEFGLNGQSMGMNSRDSTGVDQDAHDDSCTSYEGQQNTAVGLTDGLGKEEAHGNLHPEYRNDGVSSLTDHDFVVGHCDPKPWDIGCYFRGLDKEFDLLPTCNVIEEVFGNESWEKTRDGHGVS